MILQIAAGVCLGIVAAVLLLRNWRQILAGSISLALVVVVLGTLAAVAALVWANLGTVAVYAGAVLAVVILYGVPFYAYGKVSQRYPAFDALIKGSPPWDQLARIPVRLLVMLVFAVAVASLGIGALLGGVWLIDVLTTSVASHSA